MFSMFNVEDNKSSGPLSRPLAPLLRAITVSSVAKVEPAGDASMQNG